MENKGIWGWLSEIPVSALNPSISKWLFTENTGWRRHNLWKKYVPIYSFLYSYWVFFLLCSYYRKNNLSQEILFAYSHILLPLTGLFFPASFLLSVSCESHSRSTSCNPFFSNETHCMDTCGLLFLLEGLWLGAWQRCQLLIETRWLIAQGLGS